MKNKLKSLVIGTVLGATALGFSGCGSEEKYLREQEASDRVDEILDSLENEFGGPDETYLEGNDTIYFEGPVTNEEKWNGKSSQKRYTISNQGEDIYVGVQGIDPFNGGDYVKGKAKVNNWFGELSSWGWETTDSTGKYVESGGQPGYMLLEYEILHKAEYKIRNKPEIK